MRLEVVGIEIKTQIITLKWKRQQIQVHFYVYAYILLNRSEDVIMGAYKAEDDYDYLFKVVLIGDSGVEKSNIIKIHLKWVQSQIKFDHRCWVRRSKLPNWW